MNKSMHIPESLSAIRDEDIPMLAHYADHEANPLYPVPVLWDQKKLEEIYHLVQNETAGSLNEDTDFRHSIPA